MYIIVAGGGKVGYYLTKTLLSEGYEVLLIEKNSEKVEIFQERFGAVLVEGDAAEAGVLASAGAGRADVVIAVTGEDEDNLVICQIAKKKFQVGRTIARVNNPKNEQLFRMLGIDVTVSQTNYIMHLIEQSIPERSFTHLLSLRHAGLAMIDARIGVGSAVANKAIDDIDFPDQCIVAAVARGSNVFVPQGSTVLMPGDEVIALAVRDQEDDLRRLLVE
jgi:trk system potassium uptake protein TrkA